MSISRSQTTEYSTPFTNRGSASASQTPRSPLKALLALFVLSGIAALIYEIIWFQLLELVIGSSAISLGVLLATYMGGMCIGSLALARLTKLRGVHPLRLYAFLELGIGGCGLFVLAVVPLVSGVYAAIGGHGPWAIFVRAIVCAVCLLPPTVLMGATLPAASRTADATPDGVAWIGFLYGGNTIGAVIGSILAGFYLLRVFDLTVATLAAVVTNLGVAATALAAARRFDAPRSAPNALRSAQHAPRSVPIARRAAPVYLAIALSRRGRVRRRSGVDAIVVAHAWCNDIHVLDDPWRLLDGTRHRQRCRRVDRTQRRSAARRLRVVPVTAGRRDRVRGVNDRTIAPVLADQSLACAEPVVHFSAGPNEMCLDGAPGCMPLGRELSPRARVVRGGCS